MFSGLGLTIVPQMTTGNLVILAAIIGAAVLPKEGAKYARTR